MAFLSPSPLPYYYYELGRSSLQAVPVAHDDDPVATTLRELVWTMAFGTVMCLGGYAWRWFTEGDGETHDVADTEPQRDGAPKVAPLRRMYQERPVTINITFNGVQPTGCPDIDDDDSDDSDAEDTTESSDVAELDAPSFPDKATTANDIGQDDDWDDDDDDHEDHPRYWWSGSRLEKAHVNQSDEDADMDDDEDDDVVEDCHRPRVWMGATACYD